MTSSGPSSQEAVTPTEVKLLESERKRQIRQVALQVGVILLAILFVALIVIFREEPTPSVLTVCLLIGALSIFLWLTGAPGWLFAMLMLTAFVSTFAVAVSFDHLERPWSTLIPVLWIFGFFGSLLALWQSMLKVGRDEIVIIRSLTNGAIRLVNGTVAMPPVAGIEEVIARMPYSKLGAQAVLNDVPTRTNNRIPMVKATASFRIENPLKLHDSISNRAQTYQEFAKELTLSPREALLDHRFWEKIAQKQAQGALQGAVKSLIWENADDPDVAFFDRERWARDLKAKVETSLRGNGLEPLGVGVPEIETPNTTAKELLRKAKAEADARATEYTSIVEGIMRGLCGSTDDDMLRRTMIETLRSQSDKIDDKIQLVEVVESAIKQANAQRDERIDQILNSDERLMQIIMHAIETVREHERVGRDH